MKKAISFLSLLFGLFVCLTVFSACGGDDDNNKPSPNPLVGTWRTEAKSKSGELRYWDLTFTGDYKFSAKDYIANTGEVLEVTTGTYSVVNDIVTINADGFGTSAFKINGNELTFSEWDHGKVYKKIN